MALNLTVMAGLVPAIRVLFNASMKEQGWFYFMTNRRNGILYAGVTGTIYHNASSSIARESIRRILPNDMG